MEDEERVKGMRKRRKEERKEKKRKEMSEFYEVRVEKKGGLFGL